MELFSRSMLSYFVMMMMMNCFCGMVDRRKAFSLIYSRDHCQRSSPSRISDTPRAGFEPAQSLSSALVEWSCAVVITTTPRRHMQPQVCRFIKKDTLAQVFSCQFCQVFKNTFFNRTPPVAASIIKQKQNVVFNSVISNN